jgi:hypothetical protein
VEGAPLLMMGTGFDSVNETNTTVEPLGNIKNKITARDVSKFNIEKISNKNKLGITE